MELSTIIELTETRSAFWFVTGVVIACVLLIKYLPRWLYLSILGFFFFSIVFLQLIKISVL